MSVLCVLCCVMCCVRLLAFFVCARFPRVFFCLFSSPCFNCACLCVCLMCVRCVSLRVLFVHVLDICSCFFFCAYDSFGLCIVCVSHVFVCELSFVLCIFVHFLVCMYGESSSLYVLVFMLCFCLFTCVFFVRCQV